MANEKKTIKTKLVQVGNEKIDMPFSLTELILDSTSGKTVKELLDELDIEIGNPKDEDNNIEATGLYKIIDDKIGDIDFSTLQTKEDDTLVTTDKTIIGAIAEIINDYLGSKKLVYLTQAEYDLLSDTDKNDATKVYNITDAVEKDYQEKEDNALTTDDKTIVGGINELDTKVSDIKTEIGKNKIPGTPEVLEHYELSDSSNPDALEVVDDSVSPADRQITVTDANLNNSGTPFVATNYVVHIDAVASVPEVPASGLYKYIDTAILNAQLSGEEVDLSGYQTKSDADLETDDKTIIGAINALNTDSHMHIAYTQEEIEQLFDATPEEIQYYESLIQDQTVSTNRLFSSQETVNRITQALLDSQKYANDLVGGLSMVKAKKVETKPDTGTELTIYLVGNDSAGYHQWMFIEGAWADLGATNITLDGYITTEKLTEELAKKADNDKVLKLDKVTTTMSGAPSNDNVLSELAVKNLLDGKADSTSIPTVTNDLTDVLKANYDAAYTHSQEAHFDGDYNNLTNKPTIPSKTSELTNDSNLLGYIKASELGITDANDLPIGFVTGDGLANAPLAGWVNYITTYYDRNPNYAQQLAFSMQDSNVYTRINAAGTWDTWKKLLSKNDITTTINSSSTDTQIPSAKAVNTKLSAKEVIIDANDFFGYELMFGRGTGYNNTTANIPNGIIGAFTITFIPYNEGETYGTQILTPVQSSNAKYPTFIRSNDNGIWTPWQRLCTTKVADVAETKLTVNSWAKGTISYTVKNGICFVRIDSLTSTTMSTTDQTIVTGFPKPIVEQWYTALSSDPTKGGLLVCLKPDGSLINNTGIDGVSYYSGFSYPIKES